MKRMIIEPNGWKCKLSECPPGAFTFEGNLCFKSEYTVDDNGTVEAYNEGGEFFWGGTSTHDERHGLIVQPVKAVWVDEEGGE